MKKYFNYLLMAGMVCSLGMGMVACSDDDDDNNGIEVKAINLSVDPTLKSRGITVDVHSAVVEVPVKCDGEWQAYITDDVDWAQLSGNTVFHEGDETLMLFIEENHFKIDRNTTLRIITNNGDMTDIKVTQTQLWNGEVPENSSAQWFGNNGLGRGLNYTYMFEGDSTLHNTTTFNPNEVTMLNPVFNWSAIVELQGKTGDDGKKLLSADAYVENTLEQITFDDLMRDSLVHGKDSIGIRFDLEISFGFVEFEAHGAYKAKENKDAVKLNYLISRKATVYEVFTSPAELALKANELGGESEVDDKTFDKQLAAIERREANFKKINQATYKKDPNATPEQLDPDYLTPWQQTTLAKEYDLLGMPDYAGIFSPSFGKLYFKLNRAVQKDDKKSLQSLLEKLDSDYGPLFVGRGWFGGSLNMRIVVDKDSIDTDGSFEGSLAGGVNNIFHIEGDIKYMEEATRYVRNSDALIAVYGGNAVQTGNELAQHFSSDAATNRQHLLGILERWGASLMETKDDNGKSVPSKAAMQAMQLIGIWTLFEDEDVAKAVRDYMYMKHPSLAKYVGYIYDGQN